MHIYIYDHFLNQKRYDKVLAAVETKITDLGLNGRIIRLGMMNSVFSAVENEVKRGAKTIVAVGNDRLFSQTLNAMAVLESQQIFNSHVPLGYIPIGKENRDIADYLGIGGEEEAGNVLSARRIEKFDLGLANNVFFLSQAVINAKHTIINIDDEYTIETAGEGEAAIINMPIKNNLPKGHTINANDNTLELIVTTKAVRKNPLSAGKTHQSLFYFKKLLVINKNAQMVIDKTTSIPTPVEIMIAKEKINLIIGKERKF